MANATSIDLGGKSQTPNQTSVRTCTAIHPQVVSRLAIKYKWDGDSDCHGLRGSHLK